MPTVNMLQAKTQLSRLVDRIERGEETEIILARDGRPAARIVPLEAPRRKINIGMFDGEFKIPEPNDEADAEIARMFEESEIFPPGTGW